MQENWETIYHTFEQLGTNMAMLAQSLSGKKVLSKILVLSMDSICFDILHIFACMCNKKQIIFQHIEYIERIKYIKPH